MGNGGCFEQPAVAHAGQPYINERGVVHYSVPNIASRVARTASIALSNIFTPLLLHMADSGGIHQLIKEDTGVSHGTYIYKGILTNSYVGNHLNLPFKDIGLLLAAF